MAARSTLLRGAALVAAGSLAVHEARYAVSYGDDAGSVLAAQGHGYLTWIGPLVALLVAVACGVFVATLATAAPRRDRPATTRTGRIWIAASASLTLIYLLQEILEGALSSGHPAGVPGALADGGWTAVLFALAIGALIALVLRGARAAKDAVARLLPTLKAAGAPFVSILGRCAPAVPRPAVLARNLAGRAPPGTS